MMMGEQDRAQLQLVCSQRALHDACIAWIDDDGVLLVVMQKPDVIVGQRR